MKKIIYTLTLTLALASCTKEVNKADFDYTPDAANLPAVTVTFGNLTGTSADLAGNVTFRHDDSFIEKGFLISETADFAAPLSIAANALTFKATAAGLTDDTPHYVKAYVLTKDGIALSEAASFTTPYIPPQWKALEGIWTVTEDFNEDNTWKNNRTYQITVTGDPDNKKKIKIEGFAPYEDKKGHTIEATVNNMKLTLPSQELLPTWNEKYKTYFAALKENIFANNAGRAFPETAITVNSQGALEIKLRSGLETLSYMVYANDAKSGSYAGVWGYARNTVWVKNKP
jgi:hypothetical protein